MTERERPQGSGPIGILRQDQLRAGRRRALRAITSVCIVATDDGRQLREVAFDTPPTLRELAARFGPETFVVEVRIQSRGRGIHTRPELLARA